MVRSVIGALRFYAIELKCLLLLPVALVIAPGMRRRLGPRRVWLIGENFGDCLRDNAYCFFRFCQEHRAGPAAYFVAGADSIRRDAFLASNSDVLPYGSLRHLCHLLLADVFIYSHTHRDILYHKLFPLVARGRKMVFLQHGVTGFKKFNRYYQAYRNEADILTAVSDFEKTIIATRAGVDEARIRVTGFARYDSLEDVAPGTGPRRIAYMPTFRDWLTTGGFAGSRFFETVSAFLRNPDLAELLLREDLVLKFHLHKNMRDSLPFFPRSGDRVQFIAFGEESVQQTIRESRLLITDYSSVSWDFYYLGKPVIFYPFDADEYLAKRGSYLDMNKDLFGDRADSPASLVALLSAYARDGFRESAKHAAARPGYFRYSDTSNCERIHREILELHG